MHVGRRAAAVVAVTGLTAALLALTAGGVQADPSGPSFGYVVSDVSGVHTATTEKLWFTAPGNLGAAPALLTPNSYVQRYDVSEDGNVLLIAGQSRSLGVHARNSTYGLTLTVRDPLTSAVTTKILATRFEGNPVLTRDGAKAFWFDFDYLYRYDVATGFLDATTRFATKTGSTYDEQMRRIAVSSDGTKVAVLIAKYDRNRVLLSTRVKAAAFAEGVGTTFQEDVPYTATSVSPSAQTFSWSADGTTLYYSREKPDFTVETVSATIGAPAAQIVPQWPDIYDLTVHAGSFYLFHDLYDGSGNFVRTEVGSSATVADPTDWTTFPPGVSSVLYRAATVVPPVVTTPTNRSVPAINFMVDKLAVTSHRPLTFGAWASYLVDMAQFRPADSTLSTRYGVLSKSTDGGKTFTKVMTTSGATLRSMGSPYHSNGSTTELTRTSWLRWCFLGDVYVKPGCSQVIKIVVGPEISIGTQRSGTQKRVYGKATRVGGTARLQKLHLGLYKTVATTTISTTGRFSFGFKQLPVGKYRVVTTADSTWGAGGKAFSL